MWLSGRSERKWIQPKDLAAKVASLREEGKTIATLNGSFDLLHAGHLEILYQASVQADVLIVALNTDSSIQKYKSPLRPIVPLEQRKEMIGSMEMVDYVTWFDETDPRAILSIIRPDVHVNGVEYGENCIEAEVVRSHGGRIHLVERVGSLATSELINRIITLCG